MAAKDLCEEMNVEAVLKEKRLRSIKFHLSYKSCDEPITDGLRKLEVQFFGVVINAVISSIKDGVLTNFPSLEDDELAEQ